MKSHLVLAGFITDERQVLKRRLRDQALGIFCPGDEPLNLNFREASA